MKESEVVIKMIQDILNSTRTSSESLLFYARAYPPLIINTIFSSSPSFTGFASCSG